MLAIDLHGKTAVVTGGARGIGSGICRVLAAAGASVVINGTKEHREALDLKKSLIRQGAQVDFFAADVSQPAQVSELMSFAGKRFSTVDILVNNAGITTLGSIEDLRYEDLERVLQVNVFGVLTCCKEAIPHMLKAGFGRIINIASTSMYTGGGGAAPYATSKAALMGLTRNLSKEYGKHGINTNALALSLVDTPLFRDRHKNSLEYIDKIAGVPVGRMGTPEDAGYAVAFLASHMGDYINGEIITIDGGRTYA